MYFGCGVCHCQRTSGGVVADDRNGREEPETSHNSSDATTEAGARVPFDDGDPSFILPKVHIRSAATFAAFLGLFGTCIVFGTSVCIFPWWLYETSVDAIAISGFTVFLISGVFVHSLFLRAIAKTKYDLVTPFLIFHCFLLLMENIMALTAIGQIVSDEDAHVDESDILAREILFFSPIIICIQALMITCGLKFRKFIIRRDGINRAMRINPVITFNTTLPSALTDDTIKSSASEMP